MRISHISHLVDLILARAAAPLRGLGRDDVVNARAVRWLNVGAAVLVGLILAGTASAIVTMRNRAISEATRGQRTLSLMLAEQLDRTFQSVELVEQGLAAEIGRQTISGPDQFRALFSEPVTHFTLRQRVAALPHISALVLRDADGEVVNSSAEWPVKKGVLDPNPADLLRPFTGKTIVGPPTKGPIDGKWAIYLARRISSQSGQFLGMVLGTMQLQYLEDLFSKLVPTANSSIALFRSDGMLIARYPAQDGAIGKIFSEQALGAKALSSDLLEYRIASPIDGQERLVAARRLSHYPISMMLTMTVEEALSDWRTTALNLAGTSTTIIVAIAVIVLLSRRQFLGEMRIQNKQFAAALNNISQGLVMLDRDARVLICNRRYAEMYALPPELTQAGTDFRSILQKRKADGNFFGDPDERVQRLVSRAGNHVEARDLVTADGRSISIFSVSTNGGGSVATHEDITERVKREASFRLLFENNPVPMWVFDQVSLDFIAVNQAALDKYGYSREKFVSLKVTDVRPAEARERFEAWATDIPRIDSGNTMWQHLGADGRVMDVCIYSQALNYEGRDARLVAIHDVTDQKHAAEQLAKTKKFLDTVIENVPIPIVVKDVPQSGAAAESSTFSLINKAAEELYGISRAEFIGKTLSEVFPEDEDWVQFSLRLDDQTLHTDGAVVSEDHSTFNRSKGVRLVTSRRLAIRDASGRPEHLVALFEDVTDRREAEKRIEFMAHHDVLTGLANRAAFDERFAATLQQAALTGHRVSLMCMDLDGFKEINDTYGHSAGDAVLQGVAKQMMLCAEGAFIARFGGDEFAMILPDDEGLSCAELVAGRLLDSMSAELPIAGQRLKVGMTIGVAQFPQHGTDCETLLCNADVALYRAKAAEPGTVQFFAPQMGTQVRERRALQEDLRHAIAEGELTLNYQPQFAADGTLIGFEALARWNSSKRGFVSPAIFIETAEESNLILPLGEWALREACREASTWANPFKVCVNISPKQFRHGDLPALVHSILIETGLRPARLELEITEGVLIGDFSRAVSVLNRLKALGVDIALDDFGTGYSSLSYLHSFPFDLIKIDRAFVSDVTTNRHSMAIVRAVVGLGRSLGVPVLAEGVESGQQRDFLFGEGCSAIQGYLSGKPLPAAEYRHLLFAEAPSDLTEAGVPISLRK